MKLTLTADQKNDFFENGYLVLRKVPALLDHIRSIESNVGQLAESYGVSSSTNEVEKPLTSLEESQLGLFYSALRYLPSVTQLACSEILLETSKQLGLRTPAVMHSYNLRMDLPNRDKHLFHWHQDITFLLGSLNSVTYWIPLGKVDEHHGSIEVVDKSHKSGIAPYKFLGDRAPERRPISPKEIVLENDPEGAKTTIPANAGDIIVFSQFLVHRSTPNFSDAIRWVSQVRHSDLSEDAFKSAKYPFGDNTNIFHTDYLT